jgi:hypothetical protein
MVGCAIPLVEHRIEKVVAESASLKLVYFVFLPFS